MWWNAETFCLVNPRLLVSSLVLMNAPSTFFLAFADTSVANFVRNSSVPIEQAFNTGDSDRLKPQASWGSASLVGIRVRWLSQQ